MLVKTMKKTARFANAIVPAMPQTDVESNKINVMNDTIKPDERTIAAIVRKANASVYLNGLFSI